MTVNEEWRGAIAGLEFGDGTDYPYDEDGPSGLGLPPVVSSDSDRGDRDGSTAGADRYGRRVLTFPLVILGTSSSDALEKLATLKGAWPRQDSYDEVELELRYPGFPGSTSTLSYFGRPRGLVADTRLLRKGATIRTLCTFEALDPLGYEPEEESNGHTAGAFTVDNDGDETTDRVVLEITGNGGTPRVVNTSDADGDVWLDTLAGAAIRTIDLRAHTVSAGGTPAYADLNPASTWFRLRPGTNNLTLAGAASVDFTLRPAHG